MDVPLTFVVPQGVIDATGQALAQIGERAVEGVVAWVGRRPVNQEVHILNAIVPHQIAFSSDEGLAVMIPDWAVTELTGPVPDGYDEEWPIEEEALLNFDGLLDLRSGEVSGLQWAMLGV